MFLGQSQKRRLSKGRLPIDRMPTIHRRGDWHQWQTQKDNRSAWSANLEGTIAVNPWLLRWEGSVLRGSDFRWVGHIAQQVIEITEKHKPDTNAQIVPILFA